MAELTEAATLAVLSEMDWPDDREFSAHVEPDGRELTPPGAYWDMAQDVAGAVISAMKAIIRADERAKVAEEIAKAIEADCRTRHNRPDGDPCVDEDCDRHTAIARQHATTSSEEQAR